MPKIRLGIDVKGRMRRELKAMGYSPSLVDTISFYFYDFLAQDIKDGKTDYPVDTGYSRANFYARADGLYIHASYAKYVEARTKAVSKYLRKNFVSILKRAIRITGVMRPTDRGRGLLSPLLIGLVAAAFVRPERERRQTRERRNAR